MDLAQAFSDVCGAGVGSRDKLQRKDPLIGLQAKIRKLLDRMGYKPKPKTEVL